MKVPQDVAVLKCMPHLRMHILVKLHLFAKYTPPTVQTITSEGELSTLRKQPLIYGSLQGGNVAIGTAPQQMRHSQCHVISSCKSSYLV